MRKIYSINERNVGFVSNMLHYSNGQNKLEYNMLSLLYVKDILFILKSHVFNYSLCFKTFSVSIIL